MQFFQKKLLSTGRLSDRPYCLRITFALSDSSGRSKPLPYGSPNNVCADYSFLGFPLPPYPPHTREPPKIRAAHFRGTPDPCHPPVILTGLFSRRRAAPSIKNRGRGKGVWGLRAYASGGVGNPQERTGLIERLAHAPQGSGHRSRFKRSRATVYYHSGRYRSKRSFLVSVGIFVG